MNEASVESSRHCHLPSDDGSVVLPCIFHGKLIRMSTTVTPTPRSCITFSFFFLFASIVDPSSNAAENLSTARSLRFRPWGTYWSSYGWIRSNRQNLCTCTRYSSLHVYRLLLTNKYILVVSYIMTTRNGHITSGTGSLWTSRRAIVVDIRLSES